ncbi:hypothetical protein ACIQVO_17330 [Streptomyces sp. NPDC101062]|uniref:hypothetical protein n=1 Tax=unclassified Streptomyces TaxID=2593676 RepID=UPI0038097941
MSDTRVSAGPPLVFIYDRHGSHRARGTLDLRLEGCQSWAARKRWEIAGRWVDLGDQALTDHDRPKFNELTLFMREVSELTPDRTLVCLVHHWDRLTRHGDRAEYQRRIALAGGHTETTFGDDDQAAILAAGWTRHAAPESA